METSNLSVLEIQILLKCSDGNFTRTDLSQIFRKYSVLEKQKTIKRLVARGLITERKLPKLGCKKIPVFYNLTKKGSEWIKDYKKSYPVVG
jgi:DNA-binding MarR family transcriptional regulator